MSEEKKSNLRRGIRKLPVINGIQGFLRRNTNVRLFVALVGVILLWRGIWALCDKFLFPDQPVLSYCTSILLGIVLLLLDDLKLDELH